MDIKDLKFGIKMLERSYTKGEKREFKTYNLFDSSRVMKSVAVFVTMSPEDRKERVSDPLHFCFGDTQGRCEYEFMVCPWPFDDDDLVGEVGQKIDIYEMFVKPNEKLLMDMVNSVTVQSAKRYLTEERKRYR